jgi:cytochrome P450
MWCSECALFAQEHALSRLVCSENAHHRGESEVSAILSELTTMVGRDDPYPRYERLRSISPVVRADDGALVVTRYADCAAVVRDGRLGHMLPDMLAFLGLPTGPTIRRCGSCSPAS